MCFALVHDDVIKWEHFHTPQRNHTGRWNCFSWETMTYLYYSVTTLADGYLTTTQAAGACAATILTQPGCVLVRHRTVCVIVRRAGLLWSQQDFEWRWSVPLFKCLTVLEFSFILFDLCLLITFFNFIMNYVPIVTFWIFTYHKIWILSIMFCFIWSYWIIYFLACLEVSWRVVS